MDFKGLTALEHEQVSINEHIKVVLVPEHDCDSRIRRLLPLFLALAFLGVALVVLRVLAKAARVEEGLLAVLALELLAFFLFF